MIEFEVCAFCGKYKVRRYLRYNQSQDVFYEVWECLACGKMLYEEVELNDVKNPNASKEICMICQYWNMYVERNKKEGKEICLKKN